MPEQRLNRNTSACASHHEIVVTEINKFHRFVRFWFSVRACWGGRQREEARCRAASPASRHAVAVMHPPITELARKAPRYGTAELGQSCQLFRLPFLLRLWCLTPLNHFLSHFKSDRKLNDHHYYYYHDATHETVTCNVTGKGKYSRSRTPFCLC